VVLKKLPKSFSMADASRLLGQLSAAPPGRPVLVQDGEAARVARRQEHAHALGERAAQLRDLCLLNGLASEHPRRPARGARRISLVRRRSGRMIRAPLTHDHGTPPEYVALMHEVFGASPTSIRRRTRSGTSTSARSESSPRRWTRGCRRGSRARRCRTGCSPIAAASPTTAGELVHSNPPNDADGKLASFFWRTNVEYFLRGYARAVFFVGFNVEQLARNQRIGARSSPLKHPTIVPATGRATSTARRSSRRPQPMHASFITLLTHEPAHIRRFAALGRELGDVVNVHGY
jgi:hypothetical protein